MISVFSYLDYREFLKDFFHEKKSVNPHFSYQVFAAQAGFKSRSYIKLVMDGKKNMADDSIKKLNSALRLPEKSFDYLKDLVAFNQARSLQLRNVYFEKLLSYNKRNAARNLLLQQFDYFTHWYNSTIREIVSQVDFKDDFEKLGTIVKPRISARKAKASVELLLKLGLIRKNGDRYEQVDTLITTGDEVRSLAVQNFHLQNLMLAGDSISTCQSIDRDISCIIIGASEQGFAKIKEEIQLFRKKLLEFSKKDSKSKRIYHVNFQLFPTSEQLYE
jgi:uncharacterized protein (TIGR02147 family)